jgi:hypothetical protein
LCAVFFFLKTKFQPSSVARNQMEWWSSLSRIITKERFSPGYLIKWIQKSTWRATKVTSS